MRILASFNAFKGTLTAAEAGDAAARALGRVLPGAEAEVLPIADGGDGLLEALRASLGGRLRVNTVQGPHGEKVRARWLLAGRTAVIEMAEASGLRLAGGRLRPLDAGTQGVGELLLAAIRAGAKEIIVGLGGSASNDGGAGCAAAFGFELLDAAGRPVKAGARGLADLDSARPGAGQARLRGVRVEALADVRNPLCGRLGSARIFGPQKGAGPAEVKFMDAALCRYARVLARDFGIKVFRLPGGAAAGGLGAGLAAFFGAELLDGSDFVLQRVGFEKALRRCDLLITGEGRFDEQTFYGKAPGAALALARKLGKPAVVVCGSASFPPGTGLAGRGAAAVIETGRFGRDAAAVRAAVEARFPEVYAALRKKYNLP